MGVSLEQWRVGGSTGVLMKHQDSHTVEFYGLVVATLLLAAGIEPNPGPDTKGACELCGKMFDEPTGNVEKEEKDLKTLKEELENLKLLIKEKSLATKELCSKPGNSFQNVIFGLTQQSSKTRINDPNAPSKLNRAIELGGVEEVRKILLTGAVLVEHRYEDRMTPLLLASMFGHLSVVQFLIQEAGACTDAADNTSGATALHWAIKNNHVSVVEYLVKEVGMNVSLRNIQGNTPLHVAVRGNNLNIVHLLVEKNKEVIHIKNRSRLNAIHAAVQCGHLHIVKYLWERTKDIEIGKNGCVALHLACQAGHMDIIMFLLDTVGVDKSVKEGNGKYAYEFCSSNDMKELCKPK